MTMQERSMRSVFVGNIPYEATEEQLKEIFSEAGPVISFRLVYDRENGKPKGYGFCEYRDADTALSAMRNLNGYELSGRAIRVDTAASEKNKEELKNLQMSLSGPPSESPYGIECDPERAPEVISRAVASLPPEQMYELMKQMKQCIQNNPNEARNMLLQNPQLAYALLQAQVAMKIIDPQTAMTMLHRPNAEIKPLLAMSGSNFDSGSGQNSQAVPSGVQPGPMPVIPRNNYGEGPPFGGMSSGPSFPRNSLLGSRPPIGVDGRPMGGPHPHFVEPRGPSPREFDRDQREFEGGDRMGPITSGIPSRVSDPRSQRDIRDQRMGLPDQEVHGPPYDPRTRVNDSRNPSRLPRDYDQRVGGHPSQFEARDSGSQERTPTFNTQSPHYDERQGLAAGIAATPTTTTSRPSQDNEKAALIMQVLQLSDEQIALLPPEQRQSIMVLKEQIARSSQN